LADDHVAGSRISGVTVMNSTVIARDPRTGLQIRIGVMGSAANGMDDALKDTCRALGRTIAARGCCLLTGACPGMPHETVVGAHLAGGHVIGISPAATLKEHVEVHHSPYREYDVLIFTGIGLMGRELMNIYSSDIVLVVGGRSGTLGEFAIAYEAGKLIGVLQGTGGITTAIPQLEASLSGKQTGAQVLYGENPEALVDRLLDRYQSGDYVCPCHPNDLRHQEGALEVTDPVCHMNIDEQSAAGKSDYEGMTYHFCSASCKATFEQNPKHFATCISPQALMREVARP
jgi:uncharacterized protein (TIGR00725 family)